MSLRFVYRRRGPNPLGTDRASRPKNGRKQVAAPILLLFPQVKSPKRLNLDRDADRPREIVPTLILANLVQGDCFAVQGGHTPPSDR